MSSPPPPGPDWLGRNWRWGVPALVLLIAAFFYGFFSLVIGAVKSSDPYQLAVARATAAPAVQNALGTPVTVGFFVSGNIHVSGPVGQAQLEIPLAGPKGAATLYVTAQKSDGIWRFDSLVAQLRGSPVRLDLAPAAGR